MPVHFFFEDVNISIAERTRLKQFISFIFLKERRPFNSLNYIFCSDDYLLDINRQFLNHDYFTDIITFNLAAQKEPVEGEIYISTDRVKDNAALLNIPVKVELHRVIFHGALHLCGYNDKSNFQLKGMRKIEEKYLRIYFNVPRIPFF